MNRNLPVTDRIADGVPTGSPEEAAALIDDDATLVLSGFGRAGYPKAVPLALAASDRDLSLTVISGGSVGGEVDTALVEADAIERRFPYQATPTARTAVNDGHIAFHDRHISRLGDEVAFGHYGTPNVALVEAVAVGPDWLIPTTSVGHTPTYVHSASRLIVEVNDAQPLELQLLHDVYSRATPPNREPIPLNAPGDRIGSPRISFEPEKLEMVVRTDRPDKSYTFREPTETDEKIAANLAAFLADEVERNPLFASSVNLQFGVGSLGNALMGAFNDVDFGDRTVAYYGEVIQDGLLDMIDDDKLVSASAASLALSREGQERLFADIERYAERVIVRNADVSNNPALIDRFGVIGVNSALEVDLYGHVNSTHIAGTHVANGIGGSGDFTRNSGIGVIALGSTAKDGAIPRIVPMVPHVDHTEHDFSIIVTEQGVADLRGLAPRERADVMVSQCAHPSFQDDLRDYLERADKGGGHIPHDLTTVFDWYLD
ncbi:MULTISPECIES: acetyl-CoA hydrolase/transferase C-terminal domain-containing protein [Haloferax]|uniref:Acetyl-CoA hydrolase n=2 Tax=Haloferax TaxID=2251 RepID=A0A6G1Z6C6_9EURY|nr:MULTISPECIES: acetyl-CoA hydrolase/transferase C-terminal domain-containing protein [Haloferax]KAB1185469.1 acetyl-CoA hydrolase [Haloferax sp. CBA1149]MRW82119.1 acetyl-CoA hydrolase [Haloferax marinisediminis]